MAREPVKVEGLREFQASLRKLDAGLPKQIRVVLNDAVDVIVKGAQPLIPTRSGRARSSVRAQSSQREARITAGGAKAPHYAWLDFGGATGRQQASRRPFLKDGRYIYPTFRNRRATFTRKMEEALTALVKSSGLDPD